MKRFAWFLLVMTVLIAAVAQLAAVEVTVGAGDQSAPLPINFQYRNTLYETIYLSSELNIGGMITGIRFYNNFFESINNVYTNIWMGETLEQDLSGGWITPSQLTHVFADNISFPSGINNINITFPVPFFYTGNNLVMLVEHPWEDDYYMMPNYFFAQTVGTSRSRLAYNSNFPIDPNEPPPTGLTGQFPKTTFIVTVSGMGSLSGTVSSGGAPLQGAIVSVANSVITASTAADGTFNLPYLAAGTHTVSAAKLGYAPVLHTVTITAGQNTTQDFALTLLPLISVTGTVATADAPTVGLQGATVTLSGYADFAATTGTSGQFTLPGVYGNQTYTCTVSADGYQNHVAVVNAGSVNYHMGTLVLNELTFPPLNPTAVEAGDGSYVTIDWDPPSTAEEGWLHYDSGENLTGFGTQGNSFTVAIRYPAAALADYAGTSLYAMKVWPNTGAGWNLRVWTGGDAAQPGTLIVNQPFVPVLNSYNTVLLDNPVPITGSEELWFGYYISGENMSHAHAGVDAGPAVHGFGNMIQWMGNWTTLLAVNSYCDFNWNIQGYAGFGPPQDLAALMPLTLKEPRLPASDTDLSNDRPLMGYHVWRLLHGQETDPAEWTSLTPEFIGDTVLQDDGWENLSAGIYKWAIRSYYSDGGLSESVFTNPLEKVFQTGTLSGFVRNAQNLPLNGATVFVGEISANTDPSGAYTLILPNGTHDVTAWHPDYQPYTAQNVVITSGQTTIQNFNLNPLSNEDELIPVFETALTGNYPNPFSSVTGILFSLKDASPVAVRIYNLKGELVRTLCSETKQAGSHTVTWDGTDHRNRRASNGVYYYRMQAGKYSFTRKMLMLR